MRFGEQAVSRSEEVGVMNKSREEAGFHAAQFGLFQRQNVCPAPYVPRKPVQDIIGQLTRQTAPAPLPTPEVTPTFPMPLIGAGSKLAPPA